MRTTYRRCVRSFACCALTSAVLVASLAASAGDQRANPPRIMVAGIRVVAPGLGANGSELHAFNDQPGTALALAIVASPNTGIVDVDPRGEAEGPIPAAKRRVLPVL